MYVDIVFPLPFKNSFTYKVPEDYCELIQIGIRVTAPFNKRVLTGFVIAINNNPDLATTYKSIIDILDISPIFTEKSLDFYKWIADYYLSSLGEALKNSVPSGLEVETKRKIVADCDACLNQLQNEKDLNSNRAKILKYLSESSTVSLNYLKKTTKVANVYSILKTLEKRGLISIVDEVEKAKVKIKTVKFAELNSDTEFVFNKIGEIEKRSPKQAEILLYLIGNKLKKASLTEIYEQTKSNLSSIKSLEEKNLLKIIDVEETREYNERLEEDVKDITLTAKQDEIVKNISEDITNSKFTSSLLYGVTGSGKTQIYIELTKIALSKDKDILILVPEISLTPQMTGRFYNYFGKLVSVIHSKMSPGERYDSWRSLLTGKSKIVVGARSALFAPLQNIGLIIVDEEHDQSYKHNDSVPKYNAKDCALMLGKFNNCPVVLGSATPSVESMYNAQTGKYKLLELLDRIDDAKLPEIKLINITQIQKQNNMFGVFSSALLEEIKKRIEKKEGTIILQNRRGFATQVYCEDCGNIIECKDCSVPMVYHINKNILTCHYCGEIQDVPRCCPVCGSIKLKFFGTGTQRVEDELDYHFPEARIERIDSDSISKKGNLPAILNRFKNGEIDILVGTQIVSKGLDFSNVTLVGVISAETNLWMPDFRADERTFQLLTQVAGRAGRRTLKGEVLIQTLDDKNKVLKLVQSYDFLTFCENEIKKRQINLYPPFSRLCLIEMKDKEENIVKSAAQDLFKLLARFKKYITVYPPTPAMIFKLRGMYRYQIIIKSSRETDKTGSALRHAVNESLIDFNQKSRFRNIKYYVDIDPQNII